MVDLFNLTTQGVDKDLSNYKFTITGQYGSGKSTLANELFNALDGDAVTFGFEERFNGIENIRVVPIGSWDDALKYYQQLKIGVKKNGLPFKTIIIDPVGVAGEMCSRYICKREGVAEIGDIPYGGGYTMLQTEFNQWIDDLRALGFKVNYVSHGRLETIKPPRGEEYNIYTPDVPKKLIYKTQGEADFICYLDVIREVDESTGMSKAKRRLYLQNYADYQLKVPVKGLPDYIEYYDVQDGVQDFIEAFNNAVDKNYDNSLKPQKKEPKTLNNTTELTELQEKAAELRDKNLKKNGGAYASTDMKALLIEKLGTHKIAECDNIDALNSFIEVWS